MPKLMKIAGIARVIGFEKMIKGTSFSLFLKLNSGLIKTIQVTLMTFVLIHVCSCLLCMLPSFEPDVSQSWVYRYSLNDASDGEFYLTAFYICFVTFTTIGYGDYTLRTSCTL